LGIAGCGGGGSGNTMSLSVGDAPIDAAEKVVVVFTGVELIPNAGNPVTITLAAPKTIDLLSDSGTASAQLFSQPIPARRVAASALAPRRRSWWVASWRTDQAPPCCWRGVSVSPRAAIRIQAIAP